MYSGADVKYRLFFSFLKKVIFSTDLRQTLKYQISCKSVHREPRSMRTDGQTDRQTDRQRDVTKLTVAFCSFANAPENWSVSSIHVSRHSPNSLQESYEERSDAVAKPAYKVASGKN